MLPDDLRATLERKSVKPVQAFVASLMAAFREVGVLNFGVVYIATENVGRRLASIYGRESSPGKSLARIAEMLELGEYRLEEGEGEIVFAMKSESCRLCPRRVGGLELPGKLCPLPGLLSGFAGVRAEQDVKREGEYCVIRLKPESPA
jgi:hypothetical protein